MSQTNLADYGYRLPAATPGQLYDLSPRTIDSFPAGAGGVNFGQVVVLVNGAVVVPSDISTQTVVGVALKSHARENANAFQNPDEPDRLQFDTVSVLRKGRVYVTADGTIPVGAQVFAHDTDGSLDAVSTDGVAVGRAVTAGTAGQLFVLDVDL